MPQEQSNNAYLDLSQFKLEPHVREALNVALRMAQGLPLSAAHLLNSALVVQQSERTSAFSQWQSLFPPAPPFPGTRPISDQEASFPRANSFLEESFDVAVPFLLENRQFWGRDYITLALLALGDPSLDEIAHMSGRSLQSLRTAWFEFVSQEKGFEVHRPWAQWWRASGLPVPGESAKDRSPQPTYLLTWDPKRTPARELAPTMAQIEGGGDAVLRWNVGNQGIKRGDRVFFMRQGGDQPGLAGAGFVVSRTITGPHWNPAKAKEGGISYYANIRWVMLHELPLISLLELVKGTEEPSLWTSYGSGFPIPPKIATRVEALWEQATATLPQPGSQQPSPAGAQPNAVSGRASGRDPTQNVEPPVPAPQASNPPASPPPPPAQEPSGTPKRPEEWVLSDRPLEADFARQDRFRFTDYANALAAVLDHEKTETPFTIAINAPWGAGKTTLANMLAEQLQQRPIDRGHAPHIICWFNAWMHDDAPNLATALISTVGRTADEHRGLFNRLFHPLPSALLEPRRRNRRRIKIALLILVPTLWLFYWLASHLQQVDKAKKIESDAQIMVTITKDASGKEVSRTESTKKADAGTLAPKDKVDSFLDAFQSRIVVLGAFFTAMAGLLGILAKATTATSLGGFVEAHDKAAEIGAIASAEKQLRDLITQATWRGNRFVIFVDDIERCRPPRSIDVLDAVSQLLSQKGVIVVLLGDMSAVAASAQLKYKDIAEIFVPSAGIALPGPDRGKEAFGRLYLQKIIQFQFDLPIPPTGTIREYMRRLVIPQTEEGTHA